MDREALQATVYGVAKSWTQLSMHTCTNACMRAHKHSVHSRGFQATTVNQQELG